MRKPYFGRLLTAMVTPMNDDGTINYQNAADLAEFLINNGSDGLVVAGSTGEAATMSNEEKLELFKVVVNRVNKKAFVVAGTGSNDTKASIEFTKATEQTGVDGVMLVGPYYNKPTQEGFYQHFKSIAKETNLPIILYNVPGRTASNILPETICRLANEVENIVALKESAGNIEQATLLRKILPENFTIYSGDDGFTLPMMAVGCDGIISVAARVVGKKMQDMMSFFQAGDFKKAAQLNIELYDFFKVIFITTNPIPIKTAATEFSKINCGPVRLPLTELTANEKASLLKVMADL